MTVVNLGSDTVNGVTFHLPKQWKGAKEVLTLNKNVEWESVSCANEDGELAVDSVFGYCEPVYLMIK